MNSMSFEGMNKTYKLVGLLQGLFRPEVVSDYICIRCSVTQHLKFCSKMMQKENQLSASHKAFLESVITDRDELDEDDFKEAWRDWKKKTNEKKQLSIDFLHRRINKSMHLMRLPPILCIHINRVAYAPTGAEVLNSAKVSYPIEFEIGQILPEADNVQRDAQRTVYRLAALIEHVGMTPRSGHYMAYKRLFPENIDEDDKNLSLKWLKANDERLTIVEE